MKKASLLLRKEIAVLQPRFSSDIETARKAQDAIGEVEAKVLASRVRFLPQLRGQVEADFAVPKKESSLAAVILYLHGGGYTAGCLDYARGFGGILAGATGLVTLCTAYRLAPEHPYPAALEDALTAYNFLRQAYPNHKIFLAGESAGGGLCYCLCLKLRELGLPQPQAVITISPWTDLTLSFPSHQEKAAVDPSLTTETLATYARMYAPENPADPLVSPAFAAPAALAALPPTLIFVGSYEILLDDAGEMAERLRRVGGQVELHVEEGAWHAYVLYAVYEARQALRRIKAYIQEHCQ